MSPQQAQIIQAQIAVARGELRSRAVSLTIAALLSMLYCDWRFISVILALYLVCEALGHLICLRIARGPTRRDAAALLVINVLGSAAVAAIPVALSTTGDPIAYAGAVAIVGTTLVHIIMIRTTWLPYGLAAAAPLLLGSLLCGAMILKSAGVVFGPMELLVIAGMCGISGYHILRCVTVINGVKTSLLHSTEQARAANEAKSRFVAVVSHELRTSVGVVCGLVQLLKTDSDPAQHEDRVSLLETSSAALNAVLDDLLDHAKLEAGRFDLVPQPGDLHGVLRHTVDAFQVQASGKSLKLTLELGDGLPRFATFDSQRVRQVVSNLISNALKYTESGWVTVSADARLENGVWRLAVTVVDSGRGISDIQLRGLFRDYARLDGDERSGIPGTGLGLVISRGLAELMKGDIAVSSIVGRGSEFTFTACLDPADPPAASPAPVGDCPEMLVPKGMRRILVADDSRVNRLVLRAFLEAADLEIIEAEDGIEALAALRDSPFDLAILDMRMPGMTGAEVFAAIRRTGGPNRHTAVICLTGDADPTVGERCLAMGMAAYLTKPVTRDVLREAIGSLNRTDAA